MARRTFDIVQKLWSYCDVLWADGVTYHQYLSELTFLLFLKMAREKKTEGELPEGARWADLVGREGIEQHRFYRAMLLRLGDEGSARVRQIYLGAQTAIREPKNLAKLVRLIDELVWWADDDDDTEDAIGSLYEGLLEKNAAEVKSGAGQYFTPRPLVQSMVALVDPRAGERVQDPAAGTGGFLVEAFRHVHAATDKHFGISPERAVFQKREAFHGVELVPETRRLGLMNLLLHGIDEGIDLGDTLSPLGAQLTRPDVILTNPPFGKGNAGEGARRDDFTFRTNNKQLNFVQHVYRALRPGGRAAVVLPDNVLFEDGVGADIRRDLMDKCDLHTILRLPTGIFYAQGVKTNVLFFTRGRTDTGHTARVWIWDMRTGAPSFGKRTPLTRAHFTDFERAYGPDPKGTSPREAHGDDGRWRVFTRDELRARGDNLDITWLKENGKSEREALAAPDVIAAQITERLGTALAEMDALRVLLEDEG